MKTNMNEKELALLFLDGFLNLDYKHKRAIINLYEDISLLLTEPQLALDYLYYNVSPSASNTFNSAIKNDFLSVLIKKYQSRDIQVVTEESENYPIKLYQTDFKPICLYALGNVNLLSSDKTFAIVGSRKTLPAICKITENISYQLANNGVVIVTGVANGGDKSAIKGAISTGNVICVLASGCDYIEAEQNRDLIKKVIENGGLIISEYQPEIPPKNYHYPIRNRIIAGLSDGALIVSGNLKSGTRYTVDYSLDYGREVFAFPYGIGDVTGELCNRLIKDGAHLVTEVNDIVETLGYESGSETQIILTDAETEIYNLIKQGVITPDGIAQVTEKKIFEIVPILTTLELKGVIVKNSGSEYTAIK